MTAEGDEGERERVTRDERRETRERETDVTTFGRTTRGGGGEARDRRLR